MSRREIDDFSYIDVSRPVVGPDIAKFLNITRHTGDMVFGTDQSSIIVEPSLANEDALINGFDAVDEEMPADAEYPEILRIEGIGAPRLDTYNLEDLRLTLLHRRLPLDLNGTSRLRSAGRKLARIEEKTLNPIDPDKEVRTSPLYDVLSRIGYRYDVPEQEAVPIRFTAIALNPDPDFPDKGIELALIPSPADMVSHMNVAHVYMCYMGLAGHSRTAAYPSSGPVALNVPFARLPLDSHPDELERFMKVIDDHLPVRGIMGAIRRKPTIHN